MLRAGLYARVSTNDQQTLAMQSRAMREYAARSSKTRSTRKATERRPPPRDRCRAGVAPGSLGPIGHGSLGDPPGTRASRRRVRLAHGGTGPDHPRRSRDGWSVGHFRGVRKRNLTGTDTGRAGACAENGKRLGRPATVAAHAAEIRKLHRAGISKSEIARRLEVGRTSVRRILAASSSQK